MTARQHVRSRIPHMDNFSRTQIIRKAVIPTRGGVVAAAHRRAAEVGATVLDAGGDAVDAAVAISFAIGVVEPWMSGPAAGGAMVLWRAGEEPRTRGRLRHALADGARPGRLPAHRRRAGQGSLRLACGAGRSQRGRRHRRRGAGRGLRHGPRACRIRPHAVAGPACARSEAGERRPAGRLVLHAAHDLGGARACGRSRCRAHVPGRRHLADQRRLDRGLRPPPRSERHGGHAGATGAQRPARILRRRRGARAGARPARQGQPHDRSRSRRLSGAHRRCADRALPRWPHPRRARPDRRADAWPRR